MLDSESTVNIFVLHGYLLAGEFICSSEKCFAISNVTSIVCLDWPTLAQPFVG